MAVTKMKSKNSERGFSLIELLIVIGVMTVLSAMAIISVAPARMNARADAAMDAVVTQLRLARQLAIAKRRNVVVSFVSPNQIQINILYRTGEVAGNPIQPTYLNDATNAVTDTSQFMSWGALGALPITGFANGASSGINVTQLSGGTSPCVLFTTTGALVGTTCGGAGLGDLASNNPSNLAVFIGRTGLPSTARAITVMGSTGRVRTYSWDGKQWRP
jgi:prepilin-type N-terminal cleavage/methylation domain-containing protein